MSSNRRVLVITRHFWPTTTDDTLRLLQSIQHMRGAGADITVLTPRWHTDWPSKINLDGLPVQRLDHPPTSAFRVSRYSRQLAETVSRFGSQFELLYCDAPGIEAQAILSQVSGLQRPPLVVRYGAVSRGTEWQLASEKTIAVCRRANWVLASDSHAHRSLLAQGVNPASVVRAARPTGVRFERNADSRHRARQILGEVNHDLFVRGTDRVLVCPGELTQAWGVEFLIKAIAPLIEKHRSLRLWILGDSPERGKIFESLRHFGQHRVVAMPGVFTDLDQIFLAADACIFPASHQGLGWLLPTCIANSIPFLVSDSLEARQMLGDQACELTFPAEQAVELRNRLADWLHDPRALAAAAARVNRQWLAAEPSSVESADVLQLLAGQRQVPKLPQ